MKSNTLLKLLKTLQVAVLLVGPALVMSSCTDNERARHFGGTQTIEVDGKVENVTWKGEDHLWILTRPKREGEVSETHTFKEKSNYGFMEGTVIIKEK